MRRLRAICLLALVLPGFVFFQIFSGPLTVCGAGSKTIIPCRMASEAGARIVMAVVIEPEPVTCARVIPQSRPSGGCCKKSVNPAARPATGEPAVTRGCCPSDGSAGNNTRRCRTKIPCCKCLPVGFLSHMALNLPLRETPEQEFPADGTTRALHEGQKQRSLYYAHSPPLRIIARSGPQLCVEKCSFLL